MKVNQRTVLRNQLPKRFLLLLKHYKIYLMISTKVKPGLLYFPRKCSLALLNLIRLSFIASVRNLRLKR